MEKNIHTLFDELKDKGKSVSRTDLLALATEKVDLTELKAFMFVQEVHKKNPTLFKKINDQCMRDNFQAALTREEFVSMFLNEQLLVRDINAKNDPPSLDQIAELFEFLDHDRTGMITASDLLYYLELHEKAKRS